MIQNLKKAAIVPMLNWRGFMITINDCKQANERSFKGLSIDTKPVNVAPNSIFLQLNGGFFYYFNGQNWLRVGG